MTIFGANVLRQEVEDFGRTSSGLWRFVRGHLGASCAFVDGMFVRQIALISLGLLCMSTVAIPQKRAASVEIVGHVVKPEQLSPTSIQPQAFKVPAGFSVSVFAEGLGKPRMLEVADDGAVYVSRREPGDVLVLRDTNGDGRSDDSRTAVRRPMLHGLSDRWTTRLPRVGQ
jgi:glucose/arabinose dehydrogenase